MIITITLETPKLTYKELRQLLKSTKQVVKNNYKLRIIDIDRTMHE